MRLVEIGRCFSRTLLQGSSIVSPMLVSCRSLSFGKLHEDVLSKAFSFLAPEINHTVKKKHVKTNYRYKEPTKSVLVFRLCTKKLSICLKQ